MEQAIDNAKDASVEHKEDRNFEAEASKLGWQPEDKFKGDTSKWIDAKTFVERGETVLPIVKAQLRKTQLEMEELRKSAKEFEAFNEAASKREVAEWKTKYEEAIRSKSEALTNGNGEAFIEAETAQRELEANRPQTKTAVKVDPVFTAWCAENEWYGTDKKKTIRANAIGATLSDGEDGLRGRALYDAVNAELAEMEESAVVNRGSAQRGGRSAGGTKGARSYENLKPDFKAKCDKYVKEFGIKQEQYLAKCDEDAFRS